MSDVPHVAMVMRTISQNDQAEEQANKVGFILFLVLCVN